MVACNEDTNNAMILRAFCALSLNSGALGVWENNSLLKEEQLKKMK